MFDTHTHLQEDEFDKDRDDLISSLKESQVKCINIGVDLKSSHRALGLAKKYPDFLYATAGLHPHDSSSATRDQDLKEIDILAQDKDIIGIGECGLDYSRIKRDDKKDIQKSVFISQIEIAKKYDKTLVIHTRDAWEDTYDIVTNYPDVRMVLHCYTSNRSWAEKFLNLNNNVYISFSGIITFDKKNEDILEALKIVPENRLLAETDSPYLTPVPFRGNRNDSRNIKYVLQKIAEIKGKSFEDMDEILEKNALKAFNIGSLLIK